MWFIRRCGRIYAATPPNESHQCILTHFNNCNFNKAQIVCSLMMVFYTETCRSFYVNFNANLKLILRLSNFALVGEKNFDTYQDARYVRENCLLLFRNLRIMLTITM
jgi:hypothetical protein